MMEGRIGLVLVDWSHQVYFMLASIRGCSSLLRTFSTFLISSRPPLSACPSHSRSYATENWKHTKNVEVEAALARTQDLFKKYKPVSSGIRHLRRPLAPHLYEGRLIRALTVARRNSWPHHGEVSGNSPRHGQLTFTEISDWLWVLKRILD